MALPTIVPTGFSGDYKDFLKVKDDHSGAVRRVSGSVSIPGSTAQATLIGLFPFNKGMSFAGINGNTFYTADLDSGTTVTMSIGVAYQNTTEGTDLLTLIASGATTPQSGGYIAIGGTSWQDYVTTGNGWVVVSITAGPTTTTGSVTFNVPFVYDQPPLVA